MKASQIETGEASMIPKSPAAGISRGMTILDIILRFVAIASTLAAAVVMATSDQQLQFFTQVAIFNVEYEDFSTLRYFVVINSIACAYFALTIPLAIMQIARSAAKQSRALLIIMDTQHQQQLQYYFWRIMGIIPPTGTPYATNSLISAIEPPVP
ncbi:hypothetical protein AgCh_002113 [Apium graveolens]